MSMSNDERLAKNRVRYKRWYEANRVAAREQKRIAMRRLRAENPKKYNAQSRKAQRKLKGQVFDMYGRVCASCGFDDVRALTLDHVKHNGAEERKSLGERGVYRRSIEIYRPSEYRTLCMNCQFIHRVEANRQNQHG